ncbi:hypothetical protein RRG08_031915 [Elysia crispata]|uniref:Uncharacterized protein n=1 Tax=Elysia crispata TaxID=231223 RepID=A0AAE1AI58_9GAST|nr:hypothetical protein RRG08_031915 [Elysia crispata]
MPFSAVYVSNGFSQVFIAFNRGVHQAVALLHVTNMPVYKWDESRELNSIMECQPWCGPAHVTSMLVYKWDENREFYSIMECRPWCGPAHVTSMSVYKWDESRELNSIIQCRP